MSHIVSTSVDADQQCGDLSMAPRSAAVSGPRAVAAWRASLAAAHSQRAHPLNQRQTYATALALKQMPWAKAPAEAVAGWWFDVVFMVNDG